MRNSKVRVGLRQAASRHPAINGWCKHYVHCSSEQSWRKMSATCCGGNWQPKTVRSAHRRGGRTCISAGKISNSMVLPLVVLGVRIGTRNLLMRRHFKVTTELVRITLTSNFDVTMKHVRIASRLSFRKQVGEGRGWKTTKTDCTNTGGRCVRYQHHRWELRQQARVFTMRSCVQYQMWIQALWTNWHRNMNVLWKYRFKRSKGQNLTSQGVHQLCQLCQDARMLLHANCNL